jgi:hypothetical protein
MPIWLLDAEHPPPANPGTTACRLLLEYLVCAGTITHTPIWPKQRRLAAITNHSVLKEQGPVKAVVVARSHDAGHGLQCSTLFALCTHEQVGLHSSRNRPAHTPGKPTHSTATIRGNCVTARRPVTCRVLFTIVARNHHRVHNMLLTGGWCCRVGGAHHRECCRP